MISSLDAYESASTNSSPSFQSQSELSFVEIAIKNAARSGLFNISYTARQIGNPPVANGQGELEKDTLSLIQQDFVNVLRLNGYVVTRDSTGNWFISWEPQPGFTLFAKDDGETPKNYPVFSLPF